MSTSDECPLTILQDSSLMGSINESAVYNNMKCFDSGHRENRRVVSTLEVIRGSCLKL